MSAAIINHSIAGPVLALATAVTIGAIAHPAASTPRRRVSTERAPAASRRRSRWLIAAVVAGAVLAAPSAGAFPLAAGGAVTLFLRRLAPMRAGRRHRRAVERALPDAMDQLVLVVRAGLTPFQAVAELAESGEPHIGEAFAEVIRRTERGLPFADAVAGLPEHLGPSAVALADAIATSDRNGLPLGPMLDQLTVEIRAVRQRLEQADARKLPVRLAFPLVACTLPSFVLLAIAPAVIAALSSLGGTAW